MSTLAYLSVGLSPPRLQPLPEGVAQRRSIINTCKQFQLSEFISRALRVVCPKGTGDKWLLPFLSLPDAPFVREGKELLHFRCTADCFPRRLGAYVAVIFQPSFPLSKLSTHHANTTGCVVSSTAINPLSLRNLIYSDITADSGFARFR